MRMPHRQLREDVAAGAPLDAERMRKADAAPRQDRLAAQVADRGVVELVRVEADQRHEGTGR